MGGAIANAVSDALRDFGIEITALPLSPNELLELISKSPRLQEMGRD